MKINEDETFAKATIMDVIKYKIKCFFNTIYRIYCRYIELYDFEDLF